MATVRRFQKSTIRQVAALAGVSTATVSYFVNGREGVCSLETAARIRDAVAELRYTPNSLSRGLHSQSTGTIGLDMYAPVDEDDFSFFLERLWRGVMREADAADYGVLHYPHSVRTSSSPYALLDGRVDGVIIHPLDDVRSAATAAAGMPIVMLTRSSGIPDGCAAVWADEQGTMDLALSHLWSLGHRRIAHVTGPVGDPESGFPPVDIAVARMAAYTAWMSRRGAADPALIGHAGGWTGRRAPEILRAWRALPEPPTAVVCANDAIALDLIAAAEGIGLAVPQDLSVVGIDNAPHARDAAPTLTSVDVPVERIGAEAVRALLRLMQGTPAAECRVAVPVETIVVRGSSGPAPRG